MVDYNFKAFYILFRITPVAECNARLETIYAVLKKSCRKSKLKTGQLLLEFIDSPKVFGEL